MNWRKDDLEMMIVLKLGLKWLLLDVGLLGDLEAVKWVR